MSVVLRALLLIYCVALHAKPSEKLEFNKKDYVQWKQTLEKTEEMFPESEFYRIYLGRSLAPLQALHREMGAKDATSLPFSGMDDWNPYYWVRTDWQNNHDESLWKDDLKKLWKKIYAPQFKEFIPSDEIIDGRQIVLIDFASSGRSLSNTKSLLEHYLRKAKRGKIQVWTLGLTRRPINRPDPKDERRRREIKLPAYIGEKVKLENYKNFAEYPTYDSSLSTLIAPRKTSGKPRPEFDILRSTVRKFIDKDPELRCLSSLQKAMTSH